MTKTNVCLTTEVREVHDDYFTNSCMLSHKEEEEERRRNLAKKSIQILGGRGGTRND